MREGNKNSSEADCRSALPGAIFCFPKSIFLLAIIFFLTPSARAVTIYEKDDFRVKLSGHLQELTSSTHEPLFDDHVTDNTSRVRLTFRVLTGAMVSGEVSVDGTYTLGSILSSPLFVLEKNLAPPTYYNWEHAYADEDGGYGAVSIYRAMITLEAEKYRVIFGRQRLAYGTALFWSPIDIWNPTSPLALEPQEKIGVDGVSGIWWINDDLSATAFVGIADEWDEARAAASVSFQVQSYTFDLMAGKRFKDQVYGMDFVGYIGMAGVRGEFTYTVADKRDDYERAVLGIDYGWENSLYMAIEYYHNGGPMQMDPMAPFFAILGAIYMDPMMIQAGLMGLDTDELARDALEDILESAGAHGGAGSLLESSGVDTVNMNFLAATMSYDLDPLIDGSLSTIFDLDKGSNMIGPALFWYASESLTVSGGAQFYGGAGSGEFGPYADLGWLRIRWDY